MELLRGAFERAGGGHGQVVAVVGEPGVGKSRLFYEFVHSHRFVRSKEDAPPSVSGDWLVVESGSVSYGTATPYLPVIDLLKAYFQIDARDDGQKIREKVTGKLLTSTRHCGRCFRRSSRCSTSPALILTGKVWTRPSAAGAPTRRSGA
jgi:hypothetical protein